MPETTNTPESGARGRDPDRAPERTVGDRLVSRPVASETMRRSVTALREAAARRRRAADREAERLADQPLRPAGAARAAEAEASPELVRLLAQLRSAVTVFVCRSRDDEDLPVESVLAQVRALVREAESRDGWTAASDTLDTIMAQVVRWTLETYYDRPELRCSPQFY